MQLWFGRGCDDVVKYTYHEELASFQFNMNQVLHVLFHHTVLKKNVKCSRCSLERWIFSKLH